MASRAQPAGTALPVAVATLGIALFSAMDVVMKGLSLAVGAYNAVFWRMLIGVALSGIVYLVARAPRPSPAALRIHLARGAVSSVMAICFFWGLARVPLAEAVALTFVAPLAALYLAAVLLREPVGRRAVAASLIGFAGVVVILAPRAASPGDRDLWGAAAILVSALLYAYNIILMRQQAQAARPLEIAFFQNLVVAACLAAGAPFLAVVPEAVHLPAMALAALLAFASLLLLAWSYARAEAQRLAPVEYTALIWAALFGFLVFNEQVGASTIIGAGLIVAGCALAAGADRSAAPAAEAAL